MKYVIMYGGSALIGVVTSLCGQGWLLNDKFNPSGAIINTLCVIVWISLVNLIAEDK